MIELFLVVELFFVKYLFDFFEEFEKCLFEVVKCFDDFKIGDKDCIKVRLKFYY